MAEGCSGAIVLKSENCFTECFLRIVVGILEQQKVVNSLIHFFIQTIMSFLGSKKFQFHYNLKLQNET